MMVDVDEEDFEELADADVREEDVKLVIVGCNNLRFSAVVSYHHNEK